MQLLFRASIAESLSTLLVLDRSAVAGRLAAARGLRGGLAAVDVARAKCIVISRH